MNHPIAKPFVTMLLSVAFAAHLQAQGTGFTYQGFLTTSNRPAQGAHDFEFALHDTVVAGSLIGNPVITNLLVADGRFTATLDFGAAVFSGQPLWLEIGVRTNGGSAFALLSPRQPITSTPYAITADHLTGPVAASQLTGTVPSANLGGTYSGSVNFANAHNIFSGNGAALTALNVSELTGGTVPDARLGANVARTNQVWLLGGNIGTAAGVDFFGTTDNQPLELRVNNTHGWRLEYPTAGTVPNLVGGFSSNTVGAETEGAVIAGGGSSGGFENTIGVKSDYSAIGGGFNNNIASDSTYATIAGGLRNDVGVDADSSAIGGGFNNNIASDSRYATIAGGTFNEIGVDSDSSAIGGGNDNNIADHSPSATIAGGAFNDIGVGSDYSAIGGGYNNNIASDSWYATIAGGNFNDIGVDSDSSAIGGGRNNNIASNSWYATIAGGTFNEIGVDSDSSAIGGGNINNIAENAKYAVIPGGRANDVGAGASYAFAAGRRAKANHPGAFVWADSEDADFASTANNQLLIRASGGVGIGETAPKSPLHVREGSSGTPSVSPNAVAVFERSSHAYVVVLTPTNSESGLLFGSPIHSADGGVIFHSSNVPRGLEFRTGGNNVKMAIQSGGNVGIGTTSPSQKLHVVGNIMATGTITPSSDRNVKKNFAAVDALSVLERVAALPIQRWTYQAEDDTVRHVGPMAQDFHAAFGLGANDVTIATVDADGVALAAIQGLNQKLEETRAENSELRRELQEIKQLLTKLTSKQIHP